MRLSSEQGFEKKSKVTEMS